jgi:hypothetical protein
MLARLALRIATIEALRGATFAGAEVLDSQIGALHVTADGAVRTDRDQPFIAVYTDGGKVEGMLELRALHRAGATDLTVEIGIAASMVETDAETGQTVIVGLGIPATDPAMEAYLDCVGRQVANALTDPDNGWAEIWRGLSGGISKIERRRTSDAGGTRVAAHQIVVTVELLPDPVFGEPVAETSVWAKLLAKLEATGHPQLAIIRALIGGASDGSDHDALRRRFGLTLEEARAVTLADGGEPAIASVAVEGP